MKLRKALVAPLLWLSLSGVTVAQVAPLDTASAHIFAEALPQTVPEKPAPSRFLKRAVLPAVALVGLGLYTMDDNGFYSSRDAQRHARQYFPGFQNNVDDYLFFVPIAGLYGFNFFSSQNKHDIWRQTGLLLAAGAITTAIVYPTKIWTREIRPNGLPRAFPSGHTAYAFTIATVVDKEFRDKSHWISVGSYTIATATGISRILNNEHWLSDVLAGAGIGILSVNTVYFLHNRWAKNQGLNTSFVPAVLPNGELGMAWSVQF